MACPCCKLGKPGSCRKFSPGKYLAPPGGESGGLVSLSPLQSRGPGLGMLAGLAGWGQSGKSRDQLGKHTPFCTSRAPGKGP